MDDAAGNDVILVNFSISVFVCVEGGINTASSRSAKGLC